MSGAGLVRACQFGWRTGLLCSCCLQAGDLATVFENIRPRAKQAGMDGSRDALYNFFVQARAGVRGGCASAIIAWCLPEHLHSH